MALPAEAKPQRRLTRARLLELLAADVPAQPVQYGPNPPAPPKVQALVAQAQKLQAIVSQPKVQQAARTAEKVAPIVRKMRVVQVRAEQHGSCEQQRFRAPRRGHVGARRRPAAQATRSSARSGDSGDSDGSSEGDGEPPPPPARKQLVGPSPRFSRPWRRVDAQLAELVDGLERAVP